MRKELFMPYIHKGFPSFYKDGTPNEYINVILSNLPTEYIDWIMKLANKDSSFDKSKRDIFHIARIVNRHVNAVVAKILRKWKLPIRYYDVVTKLVLFNTIQPARIPIVFRCKYNQSFDGNFPLSIEFDADITKEELILYIKNYPLHKFNESKKIVLGSSVRNPRKKSETTSILKQYNRFKQNGKKNKEIYTIISLMPEFQHLSTDVIKQRILRYKG